MSKEFRTPDVTAPRFRQEAVDIVNKQFFEKFREKFPKYKNISDSEIKRIIKTFNEAFWNTVI